MCLDLSCFASQTTLAASTALDRYVHKSAGILIAAIMYMYNMSLFDGQKWDMDINNYYCVSL